MSHWGWSEATVLKLRCWCGGNMRHKRRYSEATWHFDCPHCGRVARVTVKEFSGSFRPHTVIGHPSFDDAYDVTETSTPQDVWRER